MYGSVHPAILTSAQPTDEPFVVLSFDDGPGRNLTQILDVLEQERVPALFFWQSRLLHPKKPWKRVLEGGHVIGSHTTKHVNLCKLTYEQQYREIQHSIQRIEAVTGNHVEFLRPPFGQFNEDTILAAKELNVSIVMWKVASLDWELKERPHEIVSNVTENLENGTIILLHELKHTAEILPELIQAIRQKGYGFKLI
ncbi:MAG TPA: polysaccharide deacetylase family protein [Planococcus sp. (in: firmicutes)]|nr:polysaccharide deacetylase family protein [Planococcus sp. (in: firmicutes)]